MWTARSRDSRPSRRQVRRWVRLALACAALGALALAGAPAASAATKTFTPVADSYVSSAFPNSNFGTATSMRIDGDPVDIGYLRFDATGLSGSITRARLQLVGKDSTGSGIRLHGVS